ncbi:unnamed protein product [Brugia pahangi]|uniref:Transposase n=1 Tax=Brugia pahangi TaxID=6280 RepID=A0A0N4T9R9_BRUPA|nr:unnamed protein product [Brugia pahangi]
MTDRKFEMGQDAAHQNDIEFHFIGATSSKIIRLHYL